MGTIYFRMDVLINVDSMKRIFQLEIRTHFGHAARELVVETCILMHQPKIKKEDGVVGE